MTRTAVLLMAYGSPRNLDEVEPYYTDIRRGRPPSPEALEELKDRYRAIGGTSPLNEITERQAAALERELNSQGAGEFKTYVGMKHWHPFISETVEEIQRDGAGLVVGRDGAGLVVGLALAPHYSKMSIGGYEERLLQATEKSEASFEVRMIRSWYENPQFVSFVAANLKETGRGWDAADGGTRVFFTAHSLPARILDEGDPYRDELSHSAKLVADAAGMPDWEFAFQSASTSDEPWLGPGILDRLEEFAAGGGRRALIAPIGFVADHLEILYDIDVECAGKAKELGVELRRIPSPNDHPAFVSALASVVRRHL